MGKKVNLNEVVIKKPKHEALNGDVKKPVKKEKIDEVSK